MASAITSPPGLLGALVDDGYQRCPVDTRIPALAGAIAGFSAATGNHYVLHLGGTNHLALNLYSAVVGPTGCGKETGIACAHKYGDAVNIRPASFSSEVALHRTLSADPKNGRDPRIQLVTLDEWGRMIARIQGDQNGHLRALMTLLMEIYGRALNGVVPAKRYAKAKDDLPEVKNPFVAALFVSTPRTLIKAMSSLDVVDGSLNRVPPLWIDDVPPFRPAEQINTGPLDPGLACLLSRLRLPLVTPTGAPQTGYIPPIQTSPIQGDHLTIGDQHFTVVTLATGAAKMLTVFRDSLPERRRASDHGAMWARAYEIAAKLAGLGALSEAIGTDPRAKPGKAIVSPAAAAWAIALVETTITSTLAVLEAELADYEAERIQKSILRVAERLQAEAIADQNPVVEHTAPPAIQDQMRDLKRNGWFLRSQLKRKCSGGARSSREVDQETSALIEGGALAQTIVSWKTGRDPQKREFMTRIPGG
jgi:hypothetical protein